MVFEYEKLRSLALSTAVSTDSSTSFTPRAADVFICTPSKCGTTMMQQVQLLSLDGYRVWSCDVERHSSCLQHRQYPHLPGLPPRHSAD